MTTPPLGSPQQRPEPSGSTVKERAPSPWFKPWIFIAVGVTVAALAYAVGRFQGALALTAVNERNATDRKAWQASRAACETDRGLLAARRSLALVALSLDRRNFGIAENHRRDALLAFEQPSLSGLAEAAKLAATVRALNLAVDPDPGAKREQVIAVSEALDRLLAARGSSTPAPVASAVTK
jgi:hypothetical protein